MRVLPGFAGISVFAEDSMNLANLAFSAAFLAATSDWIEASLAAYCSKPVRGF
jgi:hypothetical protein